MDRSTRVQIQAAESDLSVLIGTVESVLCRAEGSHLVVSSIERKLSPFATLFPAEILNVKLASGIRVRLFLKHLGNEDEDHPDKQDRNLEARIYETLLSDRSLPVVRYYGASENARTGRTELFLEYVDDWNLKYHELDYWYTAASRLGQLHRHFAGRPELADVLTHFDAAYHLQWAARALASVVETTPSLADRLEKVTNDYSRAARLLGEQTPTLVHNDLSPKNVIAYRSANPVRICFVDWEMAGAGFGLLDLVHLKYGLDPEADRQMRQAYADELRGSGLVPEDELEFQRLVDACELHKTMNRLWRNQVWKKPIEVVTRWVGEAEDLWRRVS